MKKSIYTLLIFLPVLIFNAAIAQTAGTPDSTFATNGFLINKINNTKPEHSYVMVQPDDKIVASGIIGFNHYGFLARYNNDGSPDVAFGDSGVIVDSVDMGIYGYRKTILLPGGKILAGGFGTKAGGSNDDIYLKRYLPNGTVDSTFGTNGFIYQDFGDELNTLYDMVVLTDGKIITVGETYSLNPRFDIEVARFNANGSLDSTFGTNGKTEIDFANDDERGRALALQSDGKILIAGVTRLGTAVDKFALARLTPDGLPDATFGTGGKQKIDLGATNNVYNMYMLPNDAFLICGSQVTVQPLVSIPYVIKFTASGVVDSTFGVNGIFASKINNGEGVLWQMALSGNKILAAGWKGTNSSNDAMLICLTADGRLDSTFATNGAYVRNFAPSEDFFQTLALDNSGRILTAGEAGTSGVIGRFNIGSLINGIEKPAATATFNLYPNPAGDRLYITGAAIANSQVAVHDDTGKLLLQLPDFTAGGIDVSKLPNGVYFVAVKTAEGAVSARRFVVSR